MDGVGWGVGVGEVGLSDALLAKLRQHLEHVTCLICITQFCPCMRQTYGFANFSEKTIFKIKGRKKDRTIFKKEKRKKERKKKAINQLNNCQV